jgi:hypothetical protein
MSDARISDAARESELIAFTFHLVMAAVSPTVSQEFAS